MEYNPILDCDSYKMPGFLGYPPDVEHVYSYAESRGGKYPATIFFGLQAWLKRLVENPILPEHVLEARDFAEAHGEPFNYDGWMKIAGRHMGRLPLLIKAVPEGTLVPTRNVLCTVENTDTEFPWLTSYVETSLLRQLWYATTVATRIFYMKQRIRGAFLRSSDTLDNLPFALLDFSSRGCANYGANEIGGAAYLANFLGSDSVPAVRYVNHYYDSKMSGFSVPATEHSIMCSWGEDNEPAAFLHMIQKMGGPGKIVSIVADTYNVFAAACILGSMADEIKQTGTTLVFRPDSGTPDEVIPQVLRILANNFGTTKNKMGYNVINGAKLLWGDGINEDTHMQPFDVAMDHGFSADSIITGSGGGLMQANIDRDTCKFAFKASAIMRKDTATHMSGWEGISKRPIHDEGKRSKEGRLYLIGNGSTTMPYRTMVQDETNRLWLNDDVLRPVYHDGRLHNMESVDTIRARIDGQL